MKALPQMIQELITQSGFTEASIASFCGVAQPTIHRIKTDANNASYTTGKKIEELYNENFSELTVAKL
jgi:transcriptional regulator with XRE-family HTH domain